MTNLFTKQSFKISLLLAIILLSVMNLTACSILNKELEIHYIFLGEESGLGDSILIQTSDGKTMLIDAGVPEAGAKVTEYLDKLNIDTIDVAINTHPHIDHIGGFLTVLENKEVNQFYMVDIPYTQSSEYKEVMELLDEKDLDPFYLESDYNFTLGDTLEFNVLYPKKGTLPDAVSSFSAPEMNNQSLVLKMIYQNNSFLFPSDIYRMTEYELLKSYEKVLDVDFVHAPHHGSDTSSSIDFIEALSPEVAVLSHTGSTDIMVRDRYEKYGAVPYSIAIDGGLIITSDGESLTVKTDKDND